MATLKPGGVLCFSVHDERLLPRNMAMSADGIHFITDSENADLDKHAYGTTHVSEAFVRRAIHQACGHEHPFFRIERGLANEQDLSVVPKDIDSRLDRLAAFRLGPWGCVDIVRVNDDGNLFVCGWAASLDDGAIEAVDLAIDGSSHACRTGISREDVREVLGDPRLATSGWEITLPMAAGTTNVFIEVIARSTAGERALLYAGRIAFAAPLPVTAPELSPGSKIARRIQAITGRLFR
jgi:hypothetical protein